MKGLLIGGAVVLGLVLGLWPGGLLKPKPAWWRWMVIISTLATVVLALATPTGGDFGSATSVTMSRGDALSMPVYGTIGEIAADGSLTLADRTGARERVLEAGPIVAEHGLKAGDAVILKLSFDRGRRAWVAKSHGMTNPLLTLPLIPGLEERARNIYFHVPSAWLAQLAWFVACFYAVLALRRKRPEDDIRAASAAAVGALFCVLATVTGAIWAKFNWGVYWNWDPRQISIFVVLVIYGAYFALRSAVQNEDQRTRLSAAYLVLMVLPVVFFLFIFPRITTGLHPGSLESGNAGPVLSAQADALNPTKQVIFSMAFFSFTLLFFWMLNVSARVGMAEYRRLRSRLERAPGAASRSVGAGVS